MMMPLQLWESGTGNYWVVVQVVAPEVELNWVVAPSSDQAGGPRWGGGTRAPVTAGGDGGQVAREQWCSVVGGGRLQAGLSQTLVTLYNNWVYWKTKAKTISPRKLRFYLQIAKI